MYLHVLRWIFFFQKVNLLPLEAESGADEQSENPLSSDVYTSSKTSVLVSLFFQYKQLCQHLPEGKRDGMCVCKYTFVCNRERNNNEREDTKQVL